MFEFFKVLLDNEQTEKKVEFNDLFYREVLGLFLNFLNTVENESIEAEPSEETSNSNARNLQYNKSLEYSRSLVV